jgi:phosphocarrier protein FPr
MKQIELVIHNPTGLHARPAAIFVKTAKQFQAKIQIQHGPKKVNAKSVISVLTLGVERGGQITIVADGTDEETALAVLKEAVENGLGEDHAPAKSNGSPAKQPPQSKPEPVPMVIGPEGLVQGIAGAPGIAIGPIYQFQATKIVVEETAAADPNQEKARLDKALDSTRADLTSLHADMVKRIGPEEAAIFEAHLAILDDPDLLETATDRIESGLSAAQAWQESVEATAAQLAQVKDELLAARAADVRDVGQRVLRSLVGAADSQPELPETPIVLVVHDLSPSDTVSLDPDRVLGFCTAAGGANAHTAILARALGLPAIVGAGPAVLGLKNGTQVILDGNTGVLTIAPGDEVLAFAKTAQQEQRARQAEALKAAKAPAITQDGHRLEVVANIGSLADARQAVGFGAEGVGLLRTEFLFLERTEPPTETEQFEIYRDIVLALADQPVIVRTLDVGGDKPLPYLPLPAEENPFLGIRGIRLSMTRPELLRTQIRAILRAAGHGPFRIMFPMVATLEEWTAARRIVSEVQQELNAPTVEVGIMIEVPAAALIAEHFAREVDFFSIGTNDLTQYTLAMDRGHPELSAQADGLHPAVLHLIDRTVRAAHAAGKWVGVCGELGANPQAGPILVGLGVDELSVSIPAIPTVKARIRSMSYAAAQDLAAQALACGTATEVRQLVDRWQSQSTSAISNGKESA